MKLQGCQFISPSTDMNQLVFIQSRCEINARINKELTVNNVTVVYQTHRGPIHLPVPDHVTTTQTHPRQFYLVLNIGLRSNNTARTTVNDCDKFHHSVTVSRIMLTNHISETEVEDKGHSKRKETNLVNFCLSKLA